MFEENVDRNGVSLVGSPHEECMAREELLDELWPMVHQNTHLKITRIDADGLLEHIKKGHDGGRKGCDLQPVVSL